MPLIFFKISFFVIKATDTPYPVHHMGVPYHEALRCKVIPRSQRLSNDRKLNNRQPDLTLNWSISLATKLKARLPGITRAREIHDHDFCFFFVVVSSPDSSTKFVKMIGWKSTKNALEKLENLLTCKIW